MASKEDIVELYEILLKEENPNALIVDCIKRLEIFKVITPIHKKTDYGINILDEVHELGEKERIKDSLNRLLEINQIKERPWDISKRKNVQDFTNNDEHITNALKRLCKLYES